MLTIVILLIFVLSFYMGWRRGLIMQAIRFLGYIITFILATQFFEPLSKWIEMLIPFPSIQPDTQLAIYDEAISFMLDTAFYRVLTFMLIGLIGWLVTNYVSLFFNRLMYYDVLHHINRIGGGIINLIIAYIVVFIILFALSLIPIEFIQQQFVNNPLAYGIVANTPLLSDFAAQMWLSVNPLS